jgi:hypothetical protein
MKNIPETDNALVLRTDFSDEKAWDSICAEIRKPVGEFQAYIDFVSDLSFNGIDAQRLLSLVSKNSKHLFVFIVDQIALSHPDHPILVMDLHREPGRTFRVIPSEVWGIENNLWLANMEFAEFADSVDPDGIFRGFAMG